MDEIPCEIAEVIIQKQAVFPSFSSKRRKKKKNKLNEGAPKDEVPYSKQMTTYLPSWSLRW